LSAKGVKIKEKSLLILLAFDTIDLWLFRHFKTLNIQFPAEQKVFIFFIIFS